MPLSQRNMNCGVGLVSARIVASVHLRVAIQAATPLRKVGGAFAESICRRRLVARDLRTNHLRDEAAMRGVALMAQERRAHLQHAFHHRTVRLVANRAFLGGRLVVMHERSALFGMALEAGIAHVIALHQTRADRTMRVMAIRAGNLAFQDGVMRGAVDLGTLVLVAGKADFKLGCLGQDFILGGVHRVAVGAGDVVTLVGASRPVRSVRVTLVTSDARCTLGFGGDAAFPPRKRRPGQGRDPPPLAPLRWPSLSPWQLVQVGVRPSATVPCLVLPMSMISGNVSLSSWQAVHLASAFENEVGTRSLRIRCRPGDRGASQRAD